MSLKVTNLFHSHYKTTSVSRTLKFVWCQVCFDACFFARELENQAVPRYFANFFNVLDKNDTFLESFRNT